ncbi:MAG: Maf family nucleotide pyrophosphatase [Paludibacteraceae bacterium]|nr:Maf family nucleotide pyrophosphatase [Paludibacteraceae bacterium]
MFILGSKSPRRKALLEGLDIKFSVRTIDTDETYPETLQPEEVPMYIAQLKADAFDDLADGDTLLTADTVVIVDGKILGKPADRDEAIKMLKMLQGRTHTVVTGICFKQQQKKIAFSDKSIVHVAKISQKDIEYYVDTYKPYDKAGAYGIQEWFGYVAIDRVEGSFFNVMGLPTHIVYKVINALDSLK